VTASGLLLTATNDRRLASQSTKFNIQKADAGEYPLPLRCRRPPINHQRQEFSIHVANERLLAVI